MTSTVRLCVAPVALSLCVALAGCSSSVSTGPAPASAQAAAHKTVASPSHVKNISGDYSGTLQDTQGGSGNATAILAQQSANAGGAIVAKQPGKTIKVEISLTVTSSNSTSGAMVVDYPPKGSGPTCTFSTNGSYDPTTNVLSGSFTAVSGCSGDTGTYNLTQLCHDTVVTGEVAWNNNPKC